MNLADELQKLHALREQGGLTDDEFTLAKKRLLEDSAENSQGAPQATPQPAAARPNESASALREFRRSLTDRWIGGVCGGLDQLTGVPSWSWRILFILTALLHGLGVVMYILLWIFVPLQKTAPQAIAPPRT
ncbi:MAG: PspC domain-containing protein [Casimicrobiaceae bacterium]